MSDDERLGSLFSALSDPTRRHIVRRLSDAGSVTATELAAGLPISRQAVAKHLAALSDAGLVAARRSGREMRYELTPRPLASAVSWLAEMGAEWDERLDALRDYLGGSGRRNRP
jgi:DNA-binding transcriptional ArsR family regulator